jgi:hypothetical protein
MLVRSHEIMMAANHSNLQFPVRHRFLRGICFPYEISFPSGTTKGQLTILNLRAAPRSSIVWN